MSILAFLRRIYAGLRAWQVRLRPARYDAKVFCIGYNKTGTTTLGKALSLLGYRHSSFSFKVWEAYQQGDIEAVLHYTAKFDSADDLPWLLEDMIPKLDKRFPGSKYVYLSREEDAWKKSFRDWTYKVKGFYPDVEAGWAAYLQHEAFVRTYFAERPTDWLELSIKDPQGYQKLAEFLGRPVKQDSFPHFNQSASPMRGQRPQS